MTRILLLQESLREVEELTRALAQDGYAVDAACDQPTALRFLLKKSHDLIVLDTAAQLVDCFHVCKTFRETGSTAALLILGDFSNSQKETDLLDAGADDYLSRPYHVQDIIMRAKALLRKVPPTSERKVLTVAGIELDTDSGTVTKRGELIHLFPMEFNLLEFLMRHPNQSFSSDALGERVWKDRSKYSPGTVRTHIKTLRKKIDSPGLSSLIKTEYRRGYRFVA